MRPEFPAVVDNTMLSTYKACPQKFTWVHLEHWRSAPSVDLRAGAAFAAGLEGTLRAFHEGRQPPATAIAYGGHELTKMYTKDGFECPEGEQKTLPAMLSALDFYFAHYPLEIDPAPPTLLPGGKLGIEVNFAEPLDSNLVHPVTGQPILYCGRLDRLADFAGGLWVMDDKTTKKLGPSWGSQYTLRSQFTGYCWGTRSLKQAPVGVLVRGVSILKPEKDGKQRHETQEAISYRPQWMVQKWHQDSVDLIVQMIKDWEGNIWRRAWDDACTSYRGCQFQQPCSTQESEKFLATRFIRSKWNPITRQEEPC